MHGGQFRCLIIELKATWKHRDRVAYTWYREQCKKLGFVSRIRKATFNVMLFVKLICGFSSLAPSLSVD